MFDIDFSWLPAALILAGIGVLAILYEGARLVWFVAQHLHWS